MLICFSLVFPFGLLLLFGVIRLLVWTYGYMYLFEHLFLDFKIYLQEYNERLCIVLFEEWPNYFL